MAVDRDTLINYLADEGGVEASTLADDTALFSSSLLDSFLMVDLIVFLEKEGGFKMGATEVNLGNLDTVGSILAYCERKSG